MAGDGQARRIRRGDAKVLALVAGRLALAGQTEDARAVASIAVRMSRLTGASEALGIARAVQVKVGAPSLPP